MLRQPTLRRAAGIPATREFMSRVRANDGRAFDAAGASGFAFLQSQLEKLDTDLTEPLQSVTHPRDITVEVGGGFPEFVSAFAANYGSTGTQFYGLQGNSNTDIAEVQADIQKGLWKVMNWSASMTITYLDLQRLEFAKRNGAPAPFSLQSMLDESCKTLWNKALDYIVYNGFLGLPGLVNNSAAPEFAVPAGASGHTDWARKSPVEILADVNLMLNTSVANSGYDAKEGMPDSLLVPYTQYAVLTNPMTLGGVGSGFTSTLDYIQKQCVAAHHGLDFKINFLPDPWIAGKGAGSTDRAVAYRNSKKSVYLQIPTPMQKGMTVPTTRNGGSYETIFVGCMSQVIFKRTQTMIYADGI